MHKALAPLLVLVIPVWAGAEPLAIKDGERIVLVGSTLIEREQSYAYWETALRAEHPGKHLVIRNLAWSGDTVEGHARAGFKTVAVGYQRLIEKVKEAKPTLIFFGYGTNESFAGKEGLDDFLKRYEKLLDDLSTTRARMVLLSPIPLENLGPPLPDPREQNLRLALYTEAIGKLAEKRKAHFVDLFTPLLNESRKVPLTDNGMHLTADGYRRTVATLFKGLGWRPDPTATLIDADSSKIVHLPIPNPSSKGRVQIRGAQHGQLTLRDKGRDLHRASAKEWEEGVTLKDAPGQKQAEELRQAIIAKNRLFFHRWRPQNVTYLFGFRKHEQGNNAKEIPQFDPLIEKAERAITALTKPQEQVQVVKENAK